MPTVLIARVPFHAIAPMACLYHKPKGCGNLSPCPVSAPRSYAIPNYILRPSALDSLRRFPFTDGVDYPLGSFPRYGYQAQRAAERRDRAIWNSIATRKNRANYYLRVEATFYNYLLEVVDGAEAKNPRAQEFLDELDARLGRIRAKLSQGQRVYFKRLGRILGEFAIAANIFPEIHQYTDKELTDLAKNVGVAKLAQTPD